MTKRCSACREVKPLDEFHKARNTADGRNNQCGACRKATDARHYERNKDKIEERNARWQGANWDRVLQIAERARRRRGARPRRVFASEAERRAACAEYSRAYVARYPERVMASKAGYVKRFPDRVKIGHVNGKAWRRGATGEVKAAQWKAILLFYGNACGHCRTPAAGRPLTADHFIPVQHGGDNTWRNVWPLCLSCNSTKRDSIPSDPHPPHVAVFEQTGVFAKEA